MEEKTEDMAKVKNEAPKTTVVLRNADSLLNLTTKRGKKVSWTLDQALEPQNFKQLSDQVQKGLLTGKTASQLLKELNK